MCADQGGLRHEEATGTDVAAAFHPGQPPDLVGHRQATSGDQPVATLEGHGLAIGRFVHLAAVAQPDTTLQQFSRVGEVS